MREGRRWTIYLVPGSHFDLGWCASPSETLIYGADIIKRAVDAIGGEFPGYRFTVEYAAFLAHFLLHHPEYLDRVRGLVAEGKLEVCASWTGMMTQALDGEAMVRNLVFAKRWAMEVLGYEPVVAQLSDCPGHAAQLPQVLSLCGVKYLAYSRYSAPCPFHIWRAPDGSEVVAANHNLGLYKSLRSPGFGGYGWGMMFREGLEEVERALPGQLRQIEGLWPAPQILMADQMDLVPGDPKVCKAAEEWNRRHPEVPVKVATIRQFFEEAEKEGLPAFSGEAPYEFYSIPAFEAPTYTLAREAENLLLSAEKFSCFVKALGLYEPDFDTIEDGWRELTVPHDHNIGGRHGEVNDWVRRHCAESAKRIGFEALEEAGMSIATHIRHKGRGEPVVVLNPLSWERTGVVETYLEFPDPEVKGVRVEAPDGREVPAQVLRHEHAGGLSRVYFAFVAEKVPPVGYRSFYVEPLGEPQSSPSPLFASPKALQSPHYRLELERGLVARAVHLPSGRNIAADGDFTLAEPIALRDVAMDIDEELTGEVLRVSDGREEPGMAVCEASCGPVFCEIVREGRIAGSTVRQRLRLYEALPWVEVLTDVDWRGARQLQLRLAFELAIPEGVATYESPFCAVTMPEGEMKGTYRGTGGRMVGKWVSVCAPDGSFGATVATSLGCASIEGPKLHMLLLRTTFSCGTPFLWYDLPGRHSFRHAILAHEGDWRDWRAFRAGWELATPLFPVRMATARPIRPWPDASLPPEGSLLSVSAENAVVTAVLPSTSREGAYIVRLFDAEGRGGETTLEFAGGIEEATEVDLLERPLRTLPTKGGKIHLQLRPWGIHTILLVPKGS